MCNGYEIIILHTKPIMTDIIYANGKLKSKCHKTYM